MKGDGFGRTERWWLALALALATWVLARGQADFIASDPLWYAVIAHDIAHGTQHFSAAELHPFVMRVGLTVPLAALYRVFGVSTLVSNLPAIGSGLSCLVLLYLTGRTRRRTLIALGLGLTCAALMHQSIALNVDLPCAALLGFSTYFISLRERGRRWLCAAVAAAFAAFLVKESAVWCAPIVGWAFAADARASTARAAFRRYLPALGCAAVLVLAYFVLCTHLWGSPLARFHGIEEVAGDHAWSLRGQGAPAWTARLTWQVPHLLFAMFGVALVPAVYGAWIARGRDRIWVVAAACFVGFYWFGSVSLGHYSPLPITERMAINCLPAILILAALGLDQAIERSRNLRWRAVPLLIFAVFLVVPAARLAITDLRRTTPETDAFAALKAALRPNEPALLLSVEPRGLSIGSFYFGFQPPSTLAMALTSDNAAVGRHPGTHVFVLVNSARGHDAALVREVEARHLPWIYRSRFITLYEAGDGSLLDR